MVGPADNYHWRQWYKGIHLMPAPGASGKPPPQVGLDGTRTGAFHRTGGSVYPVEDEELAKEMGLAPFDDTDSKWSLVFQFCLTLGLQLF